MRPFLPRNGSGLWPMLFKRQLSSKFSRTSVFMQTGLKIRELPIVVQKVNNVLKVKEICPPPSKNVVAIPPTFFDKKLMEHIEKCDEVQTLFNTLMPLPVDQVTPHVAVHSLKQLVKLKDNKTLLQPISQNHSVEEGSFLRFAFINKLMSIVYRSKDPGIILDGLRVVCQDNFVDESEEVVKYKEKMYEELLELVTQGIFSLSQVCEAVHVLSKFHPGDPKRSLAMADELWAAIYEKAEDNLDPKTIVSIFKTLPCLSQSRDLVYKMVSNAACDHWQRFNNKDIMDILSVVNTMGSIQCSYCQHTTLHMIGQWALVNVNTITDQELLALVVVMDRMDTVTSQFTTALEKYMTAKGIKIKEADLVAALCDYCNHKRLRSSPILGACSEYFTEHAARLNTPQFNSIAKVFGNLNIHPASGFKFWDRVEAVLERKIDEFPPNDLVHLLLSFVYIGIFPVNFAHKVFTTNFLDMVESMPSHLSLATKKEIDILRMALKRETSVHVKGGFLTKHFQGRSQSQPVVKGVSLALLEPLGNIIGDVKRIGFDISLPGMTFSYLYRADLLICPSSSDTFLRLDFKQGGDKKNYIAVLVHPPDDFDRSKKHLMGIQAMRARHFKILGFKVMHVQTSKVKKLDILPIELKNYLQEQYDKALKDSDEI